MVGYLKRLKLAKWKHEALFCFNDEEQAGETCGIRLVNRHCGPLTPLLWLCGQNAADLQKRTDLILRSLLPGSIKEL